MGDFEHKCCVCGKVTEDTIKCKCEKDFVCEGCCHWCDNFKNGKCEF